MRFAYVTADLLSISVSFVLVLTLRYAPNWRAHWFSSAASLLKVVPKEYFGVLLLYTVLIVLLSQTYGLYRTPRDRSQTQETVLVAKTLMWATAILMAAIYMSGSQTISRLVIVTSAGLNLVMLGSWRAWKREIVKQRVAAGISVRNIVIVGAGKIGRELGEYYRRNRHLGVVIKGFLDQNHVDDPTVLGRIENLAEICRANFVDEVIITIPFVRFRVRRALFQARLNNIDVRIVPDLHGSFARGAKLEHLGHVPVLSLRTEPIPRFGLIVKRAMDIAGSALGLMLLSPLLAVIAIAIRLESRGPAFYRAWRVGKKGRRFVCYKFRSMVKDADALKDSLLAMNERKGVTFKIAKDPRITCVGRVLRKYSLDELPQLWNVLRGDMSLVGPRPPVPGEVRRYNLDHLRRLDVTPGLTGLWQVTARSDPSFEKNIGLDLKYIGSWSIQLDFRILLKTLFVVLAGTGV